MTILFLEITEPTALLADSKGPKSGRLPQSIGVGTVTIYTLQSLVSSIFVVHCNPLSIATLSDSEEISKVTSWPLISEFTRSSLISYPIVEYFLVLPERTCQISNLVLYNFPPPIHSTILKKSIGALSP